MKKLDRDEFYREFVLPIKNSDFIKDNHEFDFYWTGKYFKEKTGIDFKYGYRGMCYYTSKNPIIAVKFKKYQLGVLRTIIHEISHAIMHNKHRKLDNSQKEIEAEGVAKEVFKKLNLTYKREYIEYHQEKYKKRYGKHYELEGSRKELFDLAVNMFVNALSPKLNVIKDLPDNEDLVVNQNIKYEVVCPECNTNWTYKRQPKIVKVNGKGYSCPYCGSGTEDKLIINYL